ncbi:MAG: PQQ-binding-like beta-propeller repeat protein [Bryobacteraceae bacterium]
MKTAIILCAAALALLWASGQDGAGWPMWGGSGDRNMASAMKGAPTSWDVQAKKNVRWMAPLGSQTYGNAVVAGGQVYIGTNNDPARNPKEPGDRGVLMCFRESDGRFLWQHTSPVLESGNANDWAQTGVCSSPLVEGDRLWYVSNRCELVCLDTRGGVVWKFDMMRETGARPHNKASSSPAAHGNLVFAATSNGRDESHARVPAPKAPSLVAVNKQTGKLVWQANSVGAKILDGQWSSPAVASIGGVTQVVIGEGDGWVRSYEAETGKRLWEFDTNAKDAVWPKTRNTLIATPVIWHNRVYIANGQDPENGPGPGHLFAIDATRRGDITQSGRVWRYDGLKRSLSTVAIANGLVFAADIAGFLHAVDAETGKPCWTHDTLAVVWGSPMVVGGNVYLGDEDGDVVVLAAARQKKQIAEMNMGSSVYATVVPAHGTLFLSNRNQLWALAGK